MMDPQTAYFFKKFYRNIIKWWFVTYNPNAFKVWPSQAEKEAAQDNEPPDESYNAATGSYSGLYGQEPVDADTQSLLNEILHESSSQTSIDSLVRSSAAASDVILPPEQEDVIKEANLIYERLMREAKEDEERKAAEIEAIKREVEAGS